MLPGGILNAVVSFASGKLYDKMGPKVLVPLGFIFTLVGAFLFSRFSTDTSIAYVIFCHLLLMIGIPLSMSPAQSSGLSAIRPITNEETTIGDCKEYSLAKLKPRTIPPKPKADVIVLSKSIFGLVQD